MILELAELTVRLDLRCSSNNLPPPRQAQQANAMGRTHRISLNSHVSAHPTNQPPTKQINLHISNSLLAPLHQKKQKRILQILTPPLAAPAYPSPKSP